MKVFFGEIEVTTKDRTELIDISSYVGDHVHKSNINDGLCLVFTSHSTVSLVVNEHERGLMQDIVKKIKEEFPKGAGWLHDRVDDNADSHLASTFIGPSRIFPVKDGTLVKGTWQNIFLLELDGPRRRKVIVEVMGE
ncbi:MAG: secondary thiamine-phosphate synthase enzyme YjbQ [Candidatus Methylarchaceae archaeon HK01B]|nr:secondary thiamine-phosphate synthase enzyme YjbQ [Candidatus Methylarchaceae archaeon HK01B]